MATTPTKPTVEVDARLAAPRVPSWPADRGAFASRQGVASNEGFRGAASRENREQPPSGRDALQALLAFSALHQQVRQRRALASRYNGFETVTRATEFEAPEQFVLDEVLQLVAERAIAITGADGLGIALAENNEIVLRASAGAIKPDVGQRIQRDSAFSGACFRTAQIIRCDDTENDDRVNLEICRKLGARSMVAVPLCGRRRVIGLLEAFSAEPFGFNDSDVGSLGLLAELILAALKPEDEERFAESAQVAEEELAVPAIAMQAVLPLGEAPLQEVGAAVAPEPQVGDEAEAASEPLVAVPVVEPAVLEQPIVQPAIVHSAMVQPAIVEAAIVQPAIVETATLPSPATTLSQPEDAIEDVVVPELAREPEHASTHHPGIVLVLVLVVVCALLAAGLWWKLKNAQLSKVMVQPEQKISRPGAVTKPPVPSTPSSVAPSSVIPSSVIPSSVAPSSIVPPSVNSSSVTPNEQTSSAPEAASGSAAPQERTKLPRISGIRHWSSADSSTVVLDLEDQVQYEAHRLTSPDRIYFDLHDTTLAPELEGKSIDIGDALLTRVRVSQPVPGVTRVVLETKGKPDFSVSLEPNPYRLVVQVRKLGADPKAQVNLFPDAATAEKPKLAIVVPPPTHEDLQLRARVPKMRIVVDAGHGGWDLGTVGRKGLLEKDLVLEIAQRLAQLLESRLGADVILTRKDDNYIPLDERAGVANQSQADLFISVHANYSDLPSARGVETYYTNFFAAPNAKDVETREPDHGKSASAAMLSASELHEKIEQSRRLAASVQRSLYGTLSVQNPGLRDRGVKEASYVVLTETAMPGILAEVSFVSSPTDEQKLRSDGYREQIAEALYKGIARYAAGSRGVKVASAAK